MRALEMYRDPRVPGQRLSIGRIDASDSDIPWWVAYTRERYGRHLLVGRSWHPTYAAAQAAVAAEFGMDHVDRAGAITEAAFAYAEVTYLEAPGLRRWRVKVGRLTYRNDVVMLVVQRRRWGRWRTEPGYETLATPATADEVVDELLDRIDQSSGKDRS